MVLELLHQLAGAAFVLFRPVIYNLDNFMLDPNFAFFGFSFIMFGIFNLTFFPIYFRTAYKFGLPTIIANLTAFLFVAGIEFLVLFNRNAANYFEGNSSEMRLVQLIILLSGAALFAGFNYAAYKISVKRFEKVNL